MPYPETEEFFMEYIQCQNCGKVVQLVEQLDKCPYCKDPIELEKKLLPGQDPKEFV